MNRIQRWIPVLVVFGAVACGGDSSSQNNSGGSSSGNGGGSGGEQHATGSHESAAGDDGGSAAGSNDASASSQPGQPVTVTAGTSTPLPAGLQPTVRITAPRDNATVATNRVEVRLTTNWNPPQDGRHIHLILDNEPYRRVDDAAHAVALENLAEGTHVLRAFPGWSTHESVKTAGAFAMVVFHVGHPTAGFTFNRNAPLLTYSRPKGDYNGTDADRVLLDFYLTNIHGEQLGANNYRVHYDIDGTAGDVTQWVPFTIEHLADGAHTITLDLIGPDGQIVPGPFNHTQRTINVNHSAPAADHSHGASTSDAGASADGH